MQRVPRIAAAPLAGLLAVLEPVSVAQGWDPPPPIERSAAQACDVCAPGAAAPPPQVQEQVRRLNEGANWRQRPSTGDTISLGPQTRMVLRRAWATGRLQPGVAPIGGASASAVPRAAARAPAANRRLTLGDRSRNSARDRRAAREKKRDRDEERSSSSSLGRSGLGKSSKKSSSSSRSSFGSGGSSFGGSFQSDDGGMN